MTRTTTPSNGNGNGNDSDSVRDSLADSIKNAKAAYVVIIEDADDDGSITEGGVGMFVTDDMPEEARQRLFKEMQLRAIIDSDVPAPIVAAIADVKDDDCLSAMLDGALGTRGPGGLGSGATLDDGDTAMFQ